MNDGFSVSLSLSSRSKDINIPYLESGQPEPVRHLSRLVLIPFELAEWYHFRHGSSSSSLDVTRHFSWPECRVFHFRSRFPDDLPARHTCHAGKLFSRGWPPWPGPIIKIESSGRGALHFVAKINWRALIVTSRFNPIPSFFFFLPFFLSLEALVD